MGIDTYKWSTKVYIHPDDPVDHHLRVRIRYSRAGHPPMYLGECTCGAFKTVSFGVEYLKREIERNHFSNVRTTTLFDVS